MIQMGEIRKSSFQNFEKKMFETTDLPILSQPFPADVIQSENNAKVYALNVVRVLH